MLYKPEAVGPDLGAALLSVDCLDARTADPVVDGLGA